MTAAVTAHTLPSLGTPGLADAAATAPAVASTPDAWQAYRISHRGERIRLLQKLCDERTTVHLHPHDGGRDTAPRTAGVRAHLRALDNARNSLSWRLSAQDPGLDGLLQAGACEAVALQDQVSLQFTLHSPLLVRAEASCVLQARLPDEIYRFQRRDSYRVSASERLAPTARFRHPAMPDMQLALRLLDISLGGCALWQPHDVPALQDGTELAEVLIELDSVSRFKTRLVLQHVSTALLGVRLGCAWVPLAGPAERTLQRWIEQSQKRQRWLSLGAEA